MLRWALLGVVLLAGVGCHDDDDYHRHHDDYRYSRRHYDDGYRDYHYGYGRPYDNCPRW